MFALSYLTRTPLPRASKKTDPTDQGVLPKYATSKEDMLETLGIRRDSLLKEMETRIAKDIQPSLNSLAARYRATIPWSEVLSRLHQLDMENHLSRAVAALESLQAARFLLNTSESCPSTSQETLARINLSASTDGPVLDLVSGLMLPPRVKPPGDIYFGYLIDRFHNDIELFEQIEAQLPQASYRALIPPGNSGSEVSKTFLSAPKKCLRSLDEFKDCVKKYLVFDRGFRDKTAYSVQIEISKVTLDLELWLKWEPKRVEIRKHMDQGMSLPPGKVIEFLERDEDLEVVAVRIPRWLKGKLEDEAKAKNEQLGAHVRQRLEDIYA